MREQILERFFDGAITKNRISHAYLIVGSSPEQKQELALRFASKINCTAEKNRPCGQCGSCLKIAHGNSADFIKIAPQGKSIKIDQIRELGTLIRFGPTEAAYLVVVIDGAENLTRESANAFLKNLEEPPERVVFLLLVSRSADLPATIASRCQRFDLGDEGNIVVDSEVEQLYGQFFEFKPRNEYNSLVLSQKLGAISGSIEQALEGFYALVAKSKANPLTKVRLGQLILETIRSLKSNANPKLTLDWFSLKWGEIIND
jgi:hypothetical protein